MRVWRLAVTASVVAAAPLGAQSAPTPEVVTTGVGEASAPPDRASIYIGVQTRATTAQAASADNARRVRGVMDTIKALGIPQGQVQTANYGVQPEMSYGPSQAPRAVGYTVTNSVVVRLNRVEDVGRVIDAALGKGANEISSLQFTSSKADSLRAVALAGAVADARSQAESMARAAGGTLGALLELNTSSVPIRPVPVMASFAMRAGAPTPITPGDQTVTATVTARWTFVPGR
jgi:hypothetical protein